MHTNAGNGTEGGKQSKWKRKNWNKQKLNFIRIVKCLLQKIKNWLQNQIYKSQNIVLSHSLYWMTIEECFIKLTKNENLKGSRKFKSRIFYQLKFMSFKIWNLNHILKPQGLTCKVISSFFFISFIFLFSHFLYLQGSLSGWAQVSLLKAATHSK